MDRVSWCNALMHNKPPSSAAFTRKSDCTRRRFLKSSAVIATGILGSGGSCSLWAEEQQAANIESETQLFLDDWIVESMSGLRRVLHQPAKKGLIKEADGRDWESGDVYMGNIVCRDGRGRFHMTYRYSWWDPGVRDLDPNIGDDKAHWQRYTTAYASSEDGIHWQKPKLGLIDGPAGFRKQTEFPYQVPAGLSKANNLGCPIDFIYDLNAHGNIQDRGKRFLLRVVKKTDTHPFAKTVESQMYFAQDWPDFARDHNWKQKLVPIEGGCLSPRGFASIAGYDERAKLWFAVSQDSIGRWKPRGGRDIARYATPDLVHWSGPELVLPIAADESKTPTDTVEYMNLDPYRVGGQTTGVWLGQLLVFHSDRNNPQYMMPTIRDVWRKGTTELRLVLSRDAGKTWQRVCDKEVWLPHHPEQHGYDRLVFAQYPLRVGNELRLYHLVYDGDHLTFNRDGSLYEPGFLRTGRTALATFRWDGYVSLDAGDQAGYLMTKPVRFQGKKLSVNVATTRGFLRVELQDQEGKPIRGFAASDCKPISTDSVEQSVSWRGQETVGPLAGKTVRLRFELTRGSLFAFGFA